MEILSPVGGKEQLIAAVRKGANAVYLGVKNFNARRNAENFSDDELIDAIKYCHARNVKVYIALNTIITDSELDTALDTVKFIAHAGVDAIIVQDLAIMKIAKEVANQLPLHASTQMSIHNSEGAEIAKDLGFCRIVPARELSKKELSEIKKRSELEMEVFVHGALCMSFSGQCYLSSVLGARSANRGMCAQPCRLNFKSKSGEYALSLKDVSLIDRINELEEIGVNSLKIEGRMKRPEYVAIATESCKKAIENAAYDKDTLKAVFSRSGFTDGYFTGIRNRELFGYRTKEDVVAATPVLKDIANSYRKETPLIAVSMELTIQNCKPVTLIVTDYTNTVSVSGDVPQHAEHRSITKEMCIKSLSKCGGTPYYLKDSECYIDDDLTISVSTINSLRKEALEQLTNIREKTVKYTVNNNYSITLKSNIPVSDTPKIYARFENEKQIQPNVDRIILDYNILYRSPQICSKFKEKLVAELPVLMFDCNKEKFKLTELKNRGITKVYVQNLYGIALANELGFEILGSFHLNILNSLSLSEYKNLGVKETDISFECNLQWFNNLRKSIPCGIVVYGKMPLMTFRACPIKTKDGCGNCNGQKCLTDRHGNEMKVICRNKQFTQLLNPYPLNMCDKINQLQNADHITLYFTDESPSECLTIINRAKARESASKDFTRGLYFKEIL